MARTIQSAGVQINEINLSDRALITGNQTVFVAGYSSQGPSDEVVQLTGGTAEFEQIFGKPTTPAERYFYHSVKHIADSTSASLLVSRLPYGAGAGQGFDANSYGVLAYPIAPVSVDKVDIAFVALAKFFEAGDTAKSFMINKPVFVQLTQDEYNSIKNGTFEWSNVPHDAVSIEAPYTTSEEKLTYLSKFGMLVVNKSQTSLNSKFEGFYVALTDNANVNPATDYDSITNMLSRNSADNTDLLTVPVARRNFSLYAASNGGSRGSISEIVESAAPFDIFDSRFNDTINLAVFKVRRDPTSSNPDALSYTVSSTFTGSLDSFRKFSSANGGQPRSGFIEDVVAGNNDFDVYVNSNISKARGSWQNVDDSIKTSVRIINKSNTGLPKSGNQFLIDEFDFGPTGNADITNPLYIAFRKIAGMAEADATKLPGSVGYDETPDSAGVLVPVSVYIDYASDVKDLGSIPAKLDRALNRLIDTDLYDIDFVVEAGLGSVWVGAVDQQVGVDDPLIYDDTKIHSDIADLDSTIYSTVPGGTISIVDDYMSIANVFLNLCQFKRKDCMFISDPLRQIFVQGKNMKTLSDKSKYFSKHIYWPVRHQYERIDSNFIIKSGVVERVYDATSDQQVWGPFSGSFAALCVNTPEVWNAPAGFDHGTVSGITDLAFTPSQKENDQMYNIGINCVKFFPRDGFVMWGQKTGQSKPNALDRIQARRTLFYLERATAKAAKYFVFKNNTFYTRQQVVNVLTPIYENVKNGVNPGLYDYRLLCNDSNNTPAVIDDNSLVIDVAVKLTRTAEYVIVNMITTRTDQNFSEVLPG